MATTTLFVTGMQRSGTTLLEKMLSSHSEISVLSQPFPFLFYETKRSFLRQVGVPETAYPLSSLFLEDEYTVEDFINYLSSYRTCPRSLRDGIQAGDSFSGQYTHFDESQIEAVVSRIELADFMSILSQLYRGFAAKSGARVFGGKETICEEFLPYLLSRGCKCLVILRDPRDVLASLNHGRGEEFGGTLKPTLFNLRNWRKSVAFALHLWRDPGFAWLRYEDLVKAPIHTLNQVAKLLGVEPFRNDTFDGGIRDQQGKTWLSNSSHFSDHFINRSSVGSHRGLLPATVIAYVEAVCYPELRFLGYEMEIEKGDITKTIIEFEDPYESSREPLRSHFSDHARRGEELQRMTLLTESAEAPRSYFLFDDVENILRGAFAN